MENVEEILYENIKGSLETGVMLTGRDAMDIINYYNKYKNKSDFKYKSEFKEYIKRAKLEEDLKFKKARAKRGFLIILLAAIGLSVNSDTDKTTSIIITTVLCLIIVFILITDAIKAQKLLKERKKHWQEN